MIENTPAGAGIREAAEGWAREHGGIYEEPARDMPHASRAGVEAEPL